MTENDVQICQSVTNMHAHSLPLPPTACPVQCQSIVTREPLVIRESQPYSMTIDSCLWGGQCCREPGWMGGTAKYSCTSVSNNTLRRQKMGEILKGIAFGSTFQQNQDSFHYSLLVTWYLEPSYETDQVVWNEKNGNTAHFNLQLYLVRNWWFLHVLRGKFP